MDYAEIKALSDSELFASFDKEESRIGARRDVNRTLLRRLANEISYRTSDGSRDIEAAERKFGC